MEPCRRVRAVFYTSLCSCVALLVMHDASVTYSLCIVRERGKRDVHSFILFQPYDVPELVLSSVIANRYDALVLGHSH